MKRGRTYYARWWLDDKWHRKSLQTTDESVALERLAEFRQSDADPGRASLSWEARKRPAHRGSLAEAKVMVRLLELGADVFVPWGHDHRSDFVAADGARLVRVQVKAAKRQGASIVVRATSTRQIAGRVATVILRSDECDVLIGYCPTTDQCYATPVVGRQEYRLNASEILSALAQIFDVAPVMAPKTISADLENHQSFQDAAGQD